ncbi:MAG: hypothetical protein A3I11_03755 [Elusimicrobia bacterium RIFCSPLOWO2_02_FULL_39_32]|nr:MAG: hypothetical protein A3B80_02325 [Elusimicrobia bacterium RIFCSPHIGHO2_02_FULL_39_36]OGR92823.1 MAG: hypothetical protein A3I11_03755 [Elusimicrobia bacterium RIFCSPLOWO2_02_FULL_39_32]OGR99607.1 MAG: hypothetical protein A3G85_01110 [Elusimicrobia bacterium RIFCSPLOWO2_12_FULL_39_28]
MNFFTIFCYGLIFGSFANVYFYRTPKQLSLWSPKSFCPTCGHPIPWCDNIPLLSFILLKGLCRFCKQKISVVYPLIELSCGILFLLVSLKFQTEPNQIVILYLIYSFILFLISGIDLITYFQNNKEYGIIPNDLIIILAAGGLLFSLSQQGGITQIWQNLLGGFYGLMLMTLVRWSGEKIFKKEALGLGDIKLMGAVGCWLGWQGTNLALILACASGTFFILPFLILKKLESNSTIPFGPFLSLGSFSALFII